MRQRGYVILCNVTRESLSDEMTKSRNLKKGSEQPMELSGRMVFQEEETQSAKGLKWEHLECSGTTSWCG